MRAVTELNAVERGLNAMNVGAPLVVNCGYEQAFPIDDLTPHPDNPRRGMVDEIVKSIRSNGFYGSVVAQRSTAFIVAGNHRWKAAKQAGMTTIPVQWIECSDATARKILLADNRTNDVAGYDDTVLADLLAEIQAESDLMGTGYDNDDLDALLAKLQLPTFVETDGSEQVDLDSRQPITCPNCGHEWVRE